MGLRTSDQLWSRRQSVRRLRLLVVVLATVCAIAAVVGSVSDKLPSQLRIGGPLATVVALLAVLAPQLEQCVKQAQEALTTKDRQLDREIARLAERSRPDLLAQVRRYWVKTELEGSLQKLARIELGLAERPAAVDYGLRALLRRPDEPDRPLEPGWPISETYRELGKQLLILGGPGAGKTTLLLELTQQLLEQAEADSTEAMPIVFELSTWALERPSLATWLIDELRKRYGVSRALGEFWLNTEQVIPLLDGLDEVGPEHRDACMAVINDFHTAHGLLPLVVCSRTAEYEALQAKLQLRGAIVIQPLTRAEVEGYLRTRGRALAGVRAILRDDEQLWELLTTPLFLTIVALTYQHKPAAAVRATGSLEQRRLHVLADYVDAMFSRPRAIARSERYPRQQTQAWLAWLAQAMRARGQTVFYLDWMQPDWLPTRAQERLVTLGVAIAVGLAAALVCGLTFGLGASIIFLVIIVRSFPEVGLVPVLETSMVTAAVPTLLVSPVYGILGSATAYGRGITPIQQLRWSSATMRRSLRRTLGFGVIVGLLLGLVYGWTLGDGGVQAAVASGVYFGGIVGLSVGLIATIGSGLETRPLVSPMGPGEGMERSRHSALVSGIGGGLSLGVVVALLLGLFIGLQAGWRAGVFNGGLAGLFGGVAFGLVFGLRRGGAAYIRHVALRWLLTRDQLAPWDYVAFLDHAGGLILLRRRGGGYEFIHRLLLEYFASLKASSSAGAGSASSSIT